MQCAKNVKNTFELNTNTGGNCKQGKHALKKIQKSKMKRVKYIGIG